MVEKSDDESDDEILDEKISFVDAADKYDSLRKIGIVSGIISHPENFDQQNASMVKTYLDDLVERGYLEKYQEEGFTRYRIPLSAETLPEIETTDFDELIYYISSTADTIDKGFEGDLQKKVDEEIIDPYGLDIEAHQYLESVAELLEIIEEE